MVEAFDNVKCSNTYSIVYVCKPYNFLQWVQTFANHLLHSLYVVYVILTLDHYAPIIIIPIYFWPFTQSKLLSLIIKSTFMGHVQKHKSRYQDTDPCTCLFKNTTLGYIHNVQQFYHHILFQSKHNSFYVIHMINLNKIPEKQCDSQRYQFEPSKCWNKAFYWK